MMGKDAQSTTQRCAVLAATGLGAIAVGRALRQHRKIDDLTGETALITGGSRGLGFLIAQQLAAAGCNIAICARHEAELEHARIQLANKGVNVLAVVCDIIDQQQVEQLIARVTEHFGQIDIVVNNAGILQLGPVTSMTVDDFEAAMATMFQGALYTTMAVLPAMTARRSGRIVTIASINGKTSVPQLLPYTAAKFAAVGFSQGLGIELARYNIHVTTIIPGLMRTGSFVHAQIKESVAAQYRWFGLFANLPLISMNAERAAQQIVMAIKRRERELVLGFPAKTLVGFQRFFPGTTQQLFKMTNRLLPTGTAPKRSNEEG